MNRLELNKLPHCKNARLIAQAIQAFDARPGPRVGDFVWTLDGKLRRFTYDWGEALQVTAYEDLGRGANFYMGICGYAEFSGSLDPGIEKTKLVDSGEIRPANFWMFDQGVTGAHRGRTYSVDVKIWREVL